MAKSPLKRSNARHSSANGAAHRIVDDVLALAATLARSRKDYGADKLQMLAQSTRDFASSLADMPNLRVQMATAADSLEGLSDYVMHTEVEQMVHDAGTFARRHPLATLGITVASGIVASRYFMQRPAGRKAASPRRASRRKTVKVTRKPASRSRTGTNGHARTNA